MITGNWPGKGEKRGGRNQTTNTKYPNSSVHFLRHQQSNMPGELTDWPPCRDRPLTLLTPNLPTHPPEQDRRTNRRRTNFFSTRQPVISHSVCGDCGELPGKTKFDRRSGRFVRSPALPELAGCRLRLSVVRTWGIWTTISWGGAGWGGVSGRRAGGLPDGGIHGTEWGGGGCTAQEPAVPPPAQSLPLALPLRSEPKLKARSRLNNTPPPRTRS